MILTKEQFQQNPTWVPNKCSIAQLAFKLQGQIPDNASELLGGAPISHLVIHTLAARRYELSTEMLREEG